VADPEDVRGAWRQRHAVSIRSHLAIDEKRPTCHGHRPPRRFPASSNEDGAGRGLDRTRLIWVRPRKLVRFL